MNSSINLFRDHLFRYPKSTVSSKNKIFISVLFGIISFLLIPYKFSFTLNEVDFNLAWTIVFPIFISLAYGWKHGLITSLLGGCFFPFFLWQGHGISPILGYLLYSIFASSFGLFAAIKEKRNSFFHIKRIGLILTIFLVIEVIYWGTTSFKNINVINENMLANNKFNIFAVFFGFKETINVIMMTSIADVLLALPIIRGLMGLKIRKSLRSNHKVFFTTSIVFVLVVGFFILFDTLTLKDINQDFAQRATLISYLMLLVFLFFSRILLNYVSTKNDIQHKMQLRNIELAIAKKEAIDDHRLKSDFLENLSHETRTPLNAIVGFTEILMNDNFSTPYARKNHLKIINESSNSLLSIINNVIEISKVEMNQIKPVYTKINLVSTIRHIINTFSENKNDDISLELQITGIEDNTYISTDKTKLVQVLNNLIVNALKFTYAGKVKIECSRTDKNELLISVIDTGIGIDSKDIDKIFVRFSQTSKIQNSGLGLGLSISKAYINSLGGDLKVESKLGIGSRFYFTIPFIQVKMETIVPINKIITPIKVGGEKKEKELILVVEDNRINFLLLKQILESNNYPIIWAEDGLVAIEKFKENRNIKLVLMDISMPRMDGYQAFNGIRKIDPEIPIVAQTAHALAEDIAKMKSHGFDDYLTKPINRTKLIKTMEYHLDKPNKYFLAN